MEGFNAAFFNELDKLRKKKKIFWAALISILAVIIGQLAITMIKNGFGLRVAGGLEFPITVLSIFIYSILPLFTAFVAIDMFCGEFSSNHMKITLARPVSRLGIFSAKILNIGVFILVNLGFVMVVSLVSGLIFNPSSGNLMSFIKIILAYASTMLPVFVLALLIVFLSNLLKNGLAVFFLSVILYVGMIFLSIVFSSYSSFFLTSMFDWYTLWISDSPNYMKITRQFLIMVGCSIMFFTAGYALFDKKDL
ncbi:MAG: ABC transporter permease [Clostridia bacterium]|nr:ABC transporter permease [Clostridia bacterium]